MRTIKFRGRDTDNGKFRYGDLIRKKGLRKKEIWQIVCNCVYFFVKPDSVGQFTDMTDADGAEVYEGDTLELDFVGAAKVIGDGSLIRDLETLKPTADAKLKVEFSHGRYQLMWRTKNGCVDTGVDLYLLEVVKQFVRRCD